MAVPANICVAWPASVGSIPTGWTRETSLDSRYILGAAAGQDTDLSTDRGATTHTHTSPAHTPTQNAHTHTFASTAGDATPTIVAGIAAGGSVAADGAHGHDATTSASATGSNNSSTITVDATSNDLSYVEVIWIKSDGTPLALPANCLAFYASDSLPSGWSRAHGDRYLKGATSGGGGGATGGANTHTHTSPPHTHTQASHSHAATVSASCNLVQSERGTGADTPATPDHTHTVMLLSETPTNQSVTTTMDTVSHEPPFSRLNTVTPSSDSLPTNIIALYLGLNSNIPTDWTRYTAMDSKWMKGCSADSQVGMTGGAATHGHTAADCQPLQNAHTHSYSSTAASAASVADSTVHNTFAAGSHTHATWDVSSETVTNNSVAVVINDCSADAALPKHRTVIYVQFTGTTPTPPRGGVYTSYHLNLFDIGDPYTGLLPEAEHRIAAGDLRYLPR